MNYFLQSLLEANNDLGQDAADEVVDDKEENDPTADTGEKDEAEPQADEAKDNAGDDQGKEEQEDDKGEEDKDDKDNEGGGDDDLGDDLGGDFDLDPEGGGDEGGEDDGPPPDGLTDPNDDGSSSSTDSQDVETNVQTNILQISKLDRTIAKRKLFSDFQDLRTQTNTFRNVIINNEENVDPELREKIYSDLDRLYTSITEYLTYKFSFINYEENLQAYLLLAKALEDVITYTSNGDSKNGKKKPFKKDTE